MQLVLLGEKGKLLLSPQQVVIRDTKDITGTKSPNTMVDQVLEIDYPQRSLQNKGIVDIGCSSHMTGNKAYLVEYQDFNGGPVAFGGSKCYITGKDTECLVLSPEFKLPDENQVLLRIPRQNNMYSFNLENIVPSGGLACLIGNLKKFDFASVKTASTPTKTQKPLVKDEEASDVDVHLYRSIIGSLMYLT
ncbi:hypothetical protein Tco_0036884, partial [Tanacetum coccineum]